MKEGLRKGCGLQGESHLVYDFNGDVSIYKTMPSAIFSALQWLPFQSLTPEIDKEAEGHQPGCKCYLQCQGSDFGFSIGAAGFAQLFHTRNLVFFNSSLMLVDRQHGHFEACRGLLQREAESRSLSNCGICPAWNQGAALLIKLRRHGICQFTVMESLC